MTEAELKTIEARANAATPGPWADRERQVRTLALEQRDEFGTAGAVAFDVGAADAPFIAHSRTDVPALLVEVRKLRALLGRVEWGTEMICPVCHSGAEPLHESWCELAEALGTEAP